MNEDTQKLIRTVRRGIRTALNAFDMYAPDTYEADKDLKETKWTLEHAHEVIIKFEEEQRRKESHR